MPTILGDTFTIDWDGSPPGMSREDTAIWKHLKQDFAKYALKVFYNVRLGSGVDPGPKYTAQERTYWISNTQLRADVFIEQAYDVLIIELRHSATADAVGRLLTYGFNLEQDNPFGKRIRLILATDVYRPDVEDACKRLGIRYLIPTAFLT